MAASSTSGGGSSSGPHPHAQHQHQQRTIVSPATFLLVVCSILALVWMAQPRRDDSPEAMRLLLLLKDDADVDASKASDSLARVVRIDRGKDKGLDPRHDRRGWMIDPLAAAQQAGLAGGATSCLVTHLGEVLPGHTRGNHRHHLYNETLVLWGAKMRVRNENAAAPEGYGEVVLGPGDVALVAGPAMQAHAISNVDLQQRTAYLMACQDGVHDPKDPHTDYKVWPDLA